MIIIVNDNHSKSTYWLLVPVSPEQDGIHGGDELCRPDGPDGGEDLLDPRVASQVPQ